MTGFNHAPLLLAAACLFCASCSTPEGWDVFLVDWQSRLEAEAQREAPVDMPGRLRPTRVGDPVSRFELPPGDEPVELTLEQAAMLALAHNRDLSVQQLEPVIVGTFEQLERGVFDPEVFAELIYEEDEASEVSRATGDQFSVVSQSRGMATGIRQRLPTGTDLELGLTQDRGFSNRTPDQHETRVGLTVTQALLRGMGPAVNLARIRQAELDTVASEYELRGFTEAVLAETERTFWTYALAKRQITIFEQSLELAQRQQKESDERIAIGVLAETEGAAAKAEVALRVQELIDARSQTERQRLRLLRLMGMSETVGDRALTPRIPQTEAPTPLDDVADRVSLAMRSRPDLNEARVRLDANRLEVLVTRNGLLPRLDLFIAVGKTGFADSFSDSVKNLDESTYDFAAGVTFTKLLGDRAAAGRNLAARASRQQAAAAVANLEDLIRLDVRLAATEVERARQQITASRATLALREETVRAEQERFRVGTSTGLLVAQAQRDLLASQIAEAQAQAAYRIALIDLYLAEGSLLERRGIAVGP